MNSVLTFEAWDAAVDDSRLTDPLWRMTAYRLAAFALETAWADAMALDKVRLTRSIGAQLYDAVASIGANLAEGYSRSSGADRVRFFEYALGSARESRVWYYAARPVLGGPVVENRIGTLDRICQLLLVAIPSERKRRIGPRL
jgi:four helix bundle protein